MSGTRRVRILLWPAGAVLGLAAEAASSGLDDPGTALPDLVTGWFVLACGLVAWGRRPDSLTGPLLAATGLTWFAGNFADLALFWHRGPLVHALLAHPGGRATAPVDRVAIGAGYAAAVVTPLWDDDVTAILLAALLGLFAALRHHAAVGRERRERAGSLAATEGLAVVLAAGAIARLAVPGGEADDPALLAYELTLCAIAFSLASGLVTRAWERGPVTDLVVELGEQRSGTLRDELAGALGDPTLEVGLWAPHERRYLDGAGRALDLPQPGTRRAVTLVQRDGAPLAALVHDPAVLDDPLLVEGIAAAAKLAAANEQLQVELRAQVAELEESRRRLVVAGDDEGRRLEERLRAGAGRRLATIAHLLGEAATGREAAHVVRAGKVLDRARADLHELAAGLYPASRSDRGLAGALEELADASVVPVEVQLDEGSLEAEVEATVYFLCAEALANVAKYAGATRAAITVRRAGGSLAVEIADDGVGGADPARGSGLRGLDDRVTALGGMLSVFSPAGGGTRLVAEIPLGGEAA
ncbi:MAG TPA: hypothetical protein VFN44_00325 [Solirubrobacteraceae bacterium]|nr:hypothetical protein [Solirubrobacteraceae bacterium]